MADHVHPNRSAAFWCKELILDLLGTGNWGPPMRPDRKLWTPVGNGSRRGLAQALGLISEPTETLPTCVLGQGATQIMSRVFDLRGDFDFGDEPDFDVHDVQWGFCELRIRDAHKNVGGLFLTNCTPPSPHTTPQRTTTILRIVCCRGLACGFNSVPSPPPSGE